MSESDLRHFILFRLLYKLDLLDLQEILTRFEFRQEKAIFQRLEIKKSTKNEGT